MTETTSRRAVLLAAAGLGAVGLAAAPSEQKGAVPKAAGDRAAAGDGRRLGVQAVHSSRRARRLEDPARHDPLAEQGDRRRLVARRAAREDEGARQLLANHLRQGGHFAAFEQPDLFVAELRKSLVQFR